MTQPDGFTPDGAWNADSFAELAAKTEEDWMAEITGRTSDPFEKFRSGLFGDLAEDLQDGLSTAAAFLTQVARGLLGNLEQTWDNVEDLIADIVDGVPNRLTEHTEAIANLNTIAAAMDSTAAYVGDLQDMVTVPRAELRSLAGAAARSVNILTGFTIIGGGTLQETLPVYYPDVQALVSTGDIYYTPIIVDRVGDVGKIRWIVGADTSVFSIDYYEVALCAYNPSTGDIEKVWGSGDITNAEADSSTLTEVEIDMGLTGQSVTPGQILFAAHQQVAPGLLQAPRAFAAVPQGDIARPSSLLLDAACYVAPAYSTGIPSSISLASLDRENRFIPWVAVTVDS